MDERIANIGNKEDCTHIKYFIQKLLAIYLKDLDKLIYSIKLDKVVRLDNAKKLNTINDSIINDIEHINNSMSDPRAIKLLGQIFRESRPQYYYASEIMDKGFKKYKGYPGDFEMMKYVYNNEVCSDNIIGKYFDKYFLDNAYAIAVRGRKNKMVNILGRFINKTQNQSLDILNLPCGPARDIKELLETVDIKSKAEIKITCVDQDEEALAFAESSISNKYKNISVSFKKGNIINYVRSMDKHINEMGKYDLVYSIGLADYLPDKLLKNMILFSFKLLKPNGKMIYAFKITDKDPFAPLPPKWFCDWQFVSRNLSDSWEVIKQSGIQGFRVQPEEWEESGRIVFLTIEKI